MWTVPSGGVPQSCLSEDGKKNQKKKRCKSLWIRSSILLQPKESWIIETFHNGAKRFHTIMSFHTENVPILWMNLRICLILSWSRLFFFFFFVNGCKRMRIIFRSLPCGLSKFSSGAYYAIFIYVLIQAWIWEKTIPGSSPTHCWF